MYFDFGCDPLKQEGAGYLCVRLPSMCTSGGFRQLMFRISMKGPNHGDSMHKKHDINIDGGVVVETAGRVK